jgi:hypothetical protein
MATEVSGVRAGGKPSGRVRCWLESVILALGSPLAIWVVSRLVSVSIRAATRGSPEQRFLIWASEGALVLWPFVIVLRLVLRSRAILLLTNLRTSPAIPWSVPLMALLLWAFWSYLGVSGWHIAAWAA